jgi:hypothetical protein
MLRDFPSDFLIPARALISKGTAIPGSREVFNPLGDPTLGKEHIPTKNPCPPLPACYLTHLVELTREKDPESVYTVTWETDLARGGACPALTAPAGHRPSLILCLLIFPSSPVFVSPWLSFPFLWSFGFFPFFFFFFFKLDLKGKKT